MSRINIDLDEATVDIVMRRYNLSTKEEAVNFALRRLAAEPMTQEQALALLHDVPVLHADRDFTALAECSTLRALERP